VTAAAFPVGLFHFISSQRPRRFLDQQLTRPTFAVEMKEKRKEEDQGRNGEEKKPSMFHRLQKDSETAAGVDRCRGWAARVS
jgi:hypothetical protein